MRSNKVIDLERLDLADAPSREPKEVQKQAEHCNDKKLASKRVQEFLPGRKRDTFLWILSSELFFSVFVKVQVYQTIPLFHLHAG